MVLSKTRYTTDGYKLSVGNIFWYWNMILGMKVQGRYKFFDRDNTVYPSTFADQLREKFEENSELPPRPDISEYVASRWPFLPRNYLQWYDNVFYFDKNQIDLSQRGGKLNILYEGPIHTVCHHEIISLHDISNLTTKNFGYKPDYGWKEVIEYNARVLQERGVRHSSGGGRRALSREHHEEVLGIISKYPKTEDTIGGLTGESFIDEAWNFNLMIMGTMGHEYPMACAGIWGYEKANAMARKIWIEQYGKNLGYWLDDTFMTEVSDRDMDAKTANTFKGSRWDSGPFDWYVDSRIALYEKLGIKSSTKDIIASNSLKNMEEILHTIEYRTGEFKPASLLGGFWANNSCNTGLNRLGKPKRGYNIVNKLVAIKVGDGEWTDICKLTNDLSKAIGTPEEIAKCRIKLKI